MEELHAQQRDRLIKQRAVALGELEPPVPLSREPARDFEDQRREFRHVCVRRGVKCSPDLKQRLSDHNGGHCPHTAKFIPWKVKFCAAFEGTTGSLRRGSVSNFHLGDHIKSRNCSGVSPASLAIPAIVKALIGL